MRLSISCERCRAKVKCVHEGRPPCQRCQKGHVQGCVLSSPRLPTQDKKRAMVGGKVTRRPNLRSSSRTREITQNTFVSTPPQGDNTCDVRRNPVSDVSSSTVVSACEVYRKKFPVANFLHYPSLIYDLSSNESKVDPVFIASLLSMCARFMSDHGLEDGEVYAEYARSELAHRAFEAPSLYIAQSLVIISFYEWGSGHPYKSWMYIGMAMYMIQSLLRTADDTMEQDPQDFHSWQTQYELLVRTYWVCFSQDCELSSGARQHFALPFRSISVPLPISDREFTFQQHPQQRLMPENMTLDYFGSERLSIDHGLALVARGFDIFVRILRYANVNRRAQVLSASSQPCFSTSTVNATWQSLKEELDEWRQLQDVTVRFPTTNVQPHVAFGSGELFTYVNLIFFMSVLFLYRDRFLFDLRRHSEIHRDNRKTTSGVEREDIARCDDEDDVICYIFEAAKNIGEILSAVEASQAPVITPYSGFSVFVAAHVNMYATIVPDKYPGGLRCAMEEKKKNLIYLERLTRFWPVGHQWWRTVQEADKFYVAAKKNESIDTSAPPRASHLALASTLDEYGDIRHERPLNDESRSVTTLRFNDTNSSRDQRHHRARRSELQPGSAVFVEDSQFSENETNNLLFHSLESELLQWPFIDETWSAGMDSRWLG